MLKQLVIILSLFIISPISVSADALKKGPPLAAKYQADKITEAVYVIHGPVADPNVENQGFMNNPAFVLTDAGVVVIDPGNSVQSGEMVIKKIREVTGQPVVAAFSSHIHGDHWLANQAVKEKYPKVKIYGHPAMIAFNHRMGRFDTSASMLGNIKALEYATDLNMTVYVPGHGQSGKSDTAIKPFLDYLMNIKTVVQDGFDNDLQDFEIKEKVIAQFKDYQSWEGFETNFGKHINSMFLEIEKLAW